MIGLLIKTRVKTFLNLLKDSRRVRFAAIIIFALLLFGYVIAGFLAKILRMAAANPELGNKVIESVVALSIHGVFLLTCFYGLSYAVYSVFFGRELELLFSLPFKRRDVFLFKVLEAAFFNSRISLIFAMPALVVMGIYHDAGFYYYVIVILLIMILTAIPGSLGIIAASFLARKVPRSKLRNALAVISALVGLSVWGGFNIFSRSFSGDFSGGPGLNNIIYTGINPVWSYFPSGWASTAAIAVARGEWVNFLYYFSLIGICAFALTVLALKAISRYFDRGVVEEFVGTSGSRFLSLGWGDSPFIAHLRRDIVIILREINALSQSLILIIFLIIFPFFAGPAGGGEPLPLSIPPSSVIFANILGCQIGSRLIPLEKLGFWLNLSIPGGSRHAILSKSIVGLVFGGLTAMLVGIIHISSGIAAEINYILFLAGFFWAGFGLGVVFSIYFGDFRWENPNRMLKMGGFFLYISSVIGIIIPFGFIAFVAGEFLPGIIDPGVLVVTLSLILVYISILVTLRKLSNFEWDAKV
jgi:ABC-2 type transport system permease protein